MTLAFIDTAFCIALGLGAVHAMEPGHGKTALFAFLARGHRSVLVATVAAASAALSHSLVLFSLALVTRFVSHSVVDLENGRVAPVLGLLSSVAILFVGVTLLRRAASHVSPYESSSSTASCSCCARRERERGPVERSTSEISSGRLSLPTGSKECWLGATLGVAGGLMPCPTAAAAFLTAVGSDPSRAYVGVLAFSLGIFLAVLLWGVLALRLTRIQSLRQVISPDAPLIRYLPALIVLAVGGVYFVQALVWLV